jgi:V/A-type H+-transporting ATPase subunit C
LTKTKPTDFLYISAVLRSREAKLLTGERISRMLDAAEYDDAAKHLIDCGYPDMTGMGASGIENALSERREAVFAEIAKSGEGARRIVDVFRMKYDYHNIKVLVKSMGANVDAARLLSRSGRVPADELTEAFISGERGDLPKPMALVMGHAVGILSRTGNPQFADNAVDRAYFAELLSEAAIAGGDFLSGYARALVDSANLRVFTRSARTGRDAAFLVDALIDGGLVPPSELTAIVPAPDTLTALYASTPLIKAAELAREAAAGGSQTMFELECDNAAMRCFDSARFTAFGPSVAATYLAELEWEITAARMILTGKLSGISSEAIRERLRESFA